MTLRFLLALWFSWAATSICAYQTKDTRLLRYADIHREKVTFVYAGDIYIADRVSGKSERLTDHIGFEAFPKFSPDGKKIAFSAEYNGSRQVYVMNADGSESTQLTYYNDVGPMPPRGGLDYRVLDWTPDGQHILFLANRLPWGERMSRPYLVPAAGGLEKALAVPESGGGMLSSDGNRFVYTPIDREFRTWKRTRGGRAQDVWIYDLKQNASKQITSHRATDQQPTVVGSDIFLVSDRESTLNLYQYVEGSNPRKLTNHKKFDVLWPSAGPEAVVYENGGYLYRFDPKNNKSERLKIDISGIRKYKTPYSKNVRKFIDSASIDNSGKRVLFTARGELFSVPTKSGPTRNLSRSPKAREIAASWSPNGRYIAYMSDKTGEYEIYVIDRKNDNKVKKLTQNSIIWRFEPKWSADSRKLLFADKNHKLWVLDIKSGNQTLIDTAKYNPSGLTTYVWSPNGQDVVYVKNNENWFSSLWHYNLKSKRKSQLTDRMTSEDNPSFSHDGHYLYFTSERDFNLSYSSYESDFVFNKATRVYVAAVNGKISAFNEIESDEVLVDIKPENSSDRNEAAEKNKLAIDNKLQSQNFMLRTEVLQAEAGNFTSLQGTNTGVLAVSENSLVFIPKDRNEKINTLVKKVESYSTSANGQYLLVQSGGEYSVVESFVDKSFKEEAVAENRIDLKGLILKIDPTLEWRQMYLEGWRTLRDWFYDENHHGQDWEEIRDRYQPLADAVAHRSDLDYVFGELAGELNAGHVYVQSGDSPQAERLKHGLLGAEISRHKSGFIKIEKIYRGENWHEQFRSPLNEPGIRAKTGQYIIAVNGRLSSKSTNFYELLENTQGKPTELLLSGFPSTKNTWKVTVLPIASETGLRYLEWVRSRKDYVKKLSNGQIGYVHLPNTHLEGHRELFKQFLPQANREALIIDDRYNGGGFIPEHLIHWIGRKPLNYWKRRGVEPIKTPQFAHDGPKAMLINGYSSSGGDALPYYFRQNGLGKLIGTRTWGGLIGISGNPHLVDGGQVIAATFRILDKDGNWIIENEGVVPDIEVIDRPELIYRGKDPSIDRAVEELMKELESKPKKKLVVPPAPTKF